MSPRTICSTLFIAVIASLFSNHFMTLFQLLAECTTDLNNSLQVFTSLPFSPVFSLYHGYKSHHHHHHQTKKQRSKCDDFPADFPPPDTNTTSIICVDPNGCCNFTTVQAAVDAAIPLSLRRTVIWINNGIYFIFIFRDGGNMKYEEVVKTTNRLESSEKVFVAKNKTNITFQGQGYTSTAIVWNDTANSTGSTFLSGSVQVFAPNFIAKNISFMNVAPIPGPGAVGAQAVAIRVGGDQAAFWGCGFFGAQDTLHDDRGRHYFKDCYVQGSIDFIFGNGRSIFENCQIISIASPVPLGSKLVDGAVTAQGRNLKDENSGFIFINCTIGGTGRIWLGRAWKPFSTVIFAYSSMTDIIAPEGWNDFNDPLRDQTIFYGEYNCSGTGANTTMRAPYVQKLNDTQASHFLNISFIDGDQWLQPYSTT